jgi:DNA primase
MSFPAHKTNASTQTEKRVFSVPATAALLNLELSGKNIRCLFPEKHSGGVDKNPSCVLYEERFKCFSCGSHGDAIDLVRIVLELSFLEARAYLEANTSFLPVAAPKQILPTLDSTLVSYQQVILTRLFELALPPTLENLGGQYLFKRKLSSEMCGGLGVRFLEDPFNAWDILCREFPRVDLKAAGLVNRAGTFHFQEHPLLVFFLNKQIPVYLAGRSLLPNPSKKELKPAGLSCPVPYQVDVLQTNPEKLYICEGLIDTLSAAQLEMPAIGAPGVNCFPQHWLELIPKTTRIHVLFDKDEAGENAGAKLRDLFRRSGFKADALVVPIGKDVNDFLFERMV